MRKNIGQSGVLVDRWGLFAAELAFLLSLTTIAVWGTAAYGEAAGRIFSQADSSQGAVMAACASAGGITFLLCLAAVLCNRWWLARSEVRRMRSQNSFLLERLEELSHMQSSLPLCPECKRVCDHEQQWYSVKEYLHDRLGTRFNHGVCPECAGKLYPASVSVCEPVLR